MAIIGNFEDSETWFDTGFPAAKEIHSNLSMNESGNLSLSDLLQAIEELKPDQGLRITTRVLPIMLSTRTRRGHYYKEDPDAEAVWRYGDRIRIRDKEGKLRWNNRKARNEEFNIHAHTSMALSDIINSKLQGKVWTGFHILSQDGRPVYRPLIFNIRGAAYAHLLAKYLDKVAEKFTGITPDIKNYGDQSIIHIPSRTKRKIPGRDYTDYFLHGVTFRHLPIDEETRFTGPVRIYSSCDCEWSRFNQGIHNRFTRSEELFCTHVVAAIELDQAYRQETHLEVRKAKANYVALEKKLVKAKKEKRKEILEKLENIDSFIKANSGSIPILSDIAYRPGKSLIYFADLLDRKVTIKGEKEERTLHEIEKEILINRKMLMEVEQNGYRKTLNSPPGDYLLHPLDRPYNFSFQSLMESDKKSLEASINALYPSE